MYTGQGKSTEGPETELPGADGQADGTEAARLAALRAYAVLDTPPEPSFDAIVGFAAEICAAPMALLGFHDADRQWFKARVGLDVPEIPRCHTFFALADDWRGPLVVPDASLDPRFRDSLFVAGPPHVRFYAGMPLVDEDGHMLGVLGILDTTPRPAALTGVQLRALETLAQQVVTQLRLRREIRRREAAQERLALALDSTEEGHWDWNVATGDVWFSDQWQRILGMTPGDVPPRIEAWQELVHPDDLPDLKAALREHLGGLLDMFESEHRMRARDGRWRWVLSRGKVVSWSPEGRPLRALGTHRDIEARKRSEAERLFTFRLNDALRAVSDAHRRMEIATVLLREQLDVAHAGFGEVDDARQLLIVQRDSHDDRMRSVTGAWPLAVFGPEIIQDLRGGATVAVADVGTDPRTASAEAQTAYGRIGARALIAVPLIRDDRLVAALFLHHDAPREWSRGEIALVEGTCERLWSAVERARTEQQLAASQELLGHAVRVGRLGIFEREFATGTTWWSPTMREMMGLGPDHPASLQAYLDLVHPDDLPKLRAGIERSNDPAGDGVCENEHRLFRPDGELRHVVIRSQCFFEGELGALRLRRTVGVIQDVTDRTQAAAALRKNEALLSAVLDALPVGVAIADAEGNLVRDNEAHRALWGRDVPVDQIDPESWAGWRNGRPVRKQQWPLARAYLHRETVRSELIETQRFSDASHRWVLNSAAPVVDESGNILGAVSAELDVTEALFADRKLRETEERYRLALGATQDAVWDWDLEGDEVIWGDAVTQLFGYAQGDIPPQASWWRDRVHPDDVEHVSTSLDEAGASGLATWSAEYRFRRVDGSYAHVLDRANIVRNEVGKPVRIIGAMLDLTERKAAEAELRQAQEDLLRISRLNAMGAVASTLAHELNQPLTATNNLLTVIKIQTAKLSEPDELIRRAVEKASSEILRASEIVRRIRRFASTGELSRRPESLSVIVTRAWDSVSQLPQAAGFRPERRLDRLADLVEVDRVQIEQVLNNLLRNAIEAMATSPVRQLKVGSALAGDMVELWVSDTGPGLSPDARAHLFEPFRSSKASGLGLGLPLCRTIVEAHGGRIWAEDAPGGGTRFMVALPRARNPEIVPA